MCIPGHSTLFVIISNAKLPFASKECVHCRISEPDMHLNFLKYLLPANSGSLERPCSSYRSPRTLLKQHLCDSSLNGYI